MADVIGLRDGAHNFAAMQMLMLPDRQLFICDTHVNVDPSAEQIAEITSLAAEAVRRFGITPSVALLSHSSFGSSAAPGAAKMRRALGLVRAQTTRHWRWTARCAATRRCRRRSSTGSSPTPHLTGEANLLIMPNVDAANISYNLLRMAAGSGITVGGILLGAAKTVHILTPSSTVRRIVNMTALAAADVSATQRTEPRVAV